MEVEAFEVGPRELPREVIELDAAPPRRRARALIGQLPDVVGSRSRTVDRDRGCKPRLGDDAQHHTVCGGRATDIAEAHKADPHGAGKYCTRPPRRHRSMTMVRTAARVWCSCNACERAGRDRTDTALPHGVALRCFKGLLKLIVDQAGALVFDFLPGLLVDLC